MKDNDTDNQNFRIRFAEETDDQIVLELINGLADFERLSNQVKVTREMIRKNIFENKFAEVLLAEYGSIPVGYALFFHNFSTFVGKPGIYLEDLYVKSEYRGKGFGKRLLVHLVKLAKERDCGRVEWAVLNWNEKAISFYKSLGAMPMNDWTVYRLAEREIEQISRGS